MASINWILVAVLISVCSAAKLHRAYLPPESAATAGGSSEFLQTPLIKSTNELNAEVPVGGFVNDAQGVVVDAAASGTRASEAETGLGKPRVTYGSTDSKVGDAAFRDTSRLNQNINQNRNRILTSPGIQQQNPQFQTYQISTPEPVQRTRDRTSNIIRYTNDIGIDSYNYGFESDNGIVVHANGVSADGVQSQGGYSYVGDDGKVYSVTYTANAGGYQPMGAHIPTPPPIPAEILKSLEVNAKSEAAGIIDDGSYDAKKYNSEDYTQNNIDNKYNDRQSNKVQNQFAALGDKSSSFIQQNNPNIRPQSFDTQNSSPFIQNNNNNAFSTSTNLDKGFPQNGQNNYQAIQPFSSQNYQQQTQNSNTFLNNKVSTPNYSSKIEHVIPLSQQSLQESSEVNKSNVPISSPPTSYDTPLSGKLPEQPNFLSPMIGSYNQSPNIHSVQNKQSMFSSSFQPSTSNTQSSSLSFFGAPNRDFTQQYQQSINSNPISSLDYSVVQQHSNYQTTNKISNPILNNGDKKILLSSEANPTQISYELSNQNNFITNQPQPNDNNLLQSSLLGFNSQFPENLNSLTQGKPQIISQQSYYPGGSLDTQNSIYNSPNADSYNNPLKPITMSFIQNQDVFPVSMNTFLQNQALSISQSNSRLPTVPPSQTLLTPKEDNPDYNKTPGNSLAQTSPFPSIAPTFPQFDFPQQVSTFAFASSDQSNNNVSPITQTLNNPSDNKVNTQTQAIFITSNKENANSQTSSVQNSGEIYEYNKPTQMFPTSSAGQSSPSQFQIQNNNGGSQNSFPIQGQQLGHPFNKLSHNQQNQFISVQNMTIPNQSNYFIPKPLPSRPSKSEFGCCSGSKFPEKQSNPVENLAIDKNLPKPLPSRPSKSEFGCCPDSNFPENQLNQVEKLAFDKNLLKPLPSRPSKSEFGCCPGSKFPEKQSNPIENPAVDRNLNQSGVRQPNPLVMKVSDILSSKREDFSQAHNPTRFDGSGYYYK